MSIGPLELTLLVAIFVGLGFFIRFIVRRIRR